MECIERVMIMIKTHSCLWKEKDEEMLHLKRESQA